MARQGYESSESHIDEWRGAISQLYVAHDPCAAFSLKFCETGRSVFA